MDKEQTKTATEFLMVEIPKLTRCLFAELDIDIRTNNITYKVLNCHILAEYIKTLAERI